MSGLPWYRRWWANPGEMVGVVRGAKAKYKVTFEGDDGTHWSLSLGPSGVPAHRCLWDYHAEALTVVKPDHDGIVAGAATELAALCQTLAGPTLARGLLPPQQDVLNAVGQDLDLQEWITGRKLRAGFPDNQEEKVRQALRQLQPRYLSEDQGDKGDYWRATLPGLLASSNVERANKVIEAVLSVLDKLFHQDPDVSRYSLDDVFTEGKFGNEDRGFIANVVSITGLSLGGSGSGTGRNVTWTWGVPKDIERLRRCHSVADFFAYVREGETDRPWPTAPLRSIALPGDSGAVDTQRHASSATAAVEYDVALSFAGEDRASAEQLARLLAEAGAKVFYDEYEQATLWGANLYDHLHDVYCNRARYCVMFISSAYATRLWTNHERQAAQARAFRERTEYILPIRIDQTKLPGLPDTIGYVSIGDGLDTISKLVLQKLGRTANTTGDIPTESSPGPGSRASGGDRARLASAAAKLIARAQDTSQRLAPVVGEMLGFSLENDCERLAHLCGMELRGWHGTELADTDPEYPRYRMINSYVSFREIDSQSPSWGGDLSAVLEFLANSTDARQVRILMPQPLAELDRMAEQSNPKALVRWAGPIREFFRDASGPDLTGYFYARGDAMVDVVDRVRGRLTTLLLTYIASLRSSV